MTLHYHDGPRTFDPEPVRSKSLAARLWTSFPGGAGYASHSDRAKAAYGRTNKISPAGWGLWGLPLLFIILWVYTLWWGEQVVFQRNVKECSWERWEQWVNVKSSFSKSILVAER